MTFSWRPLASLVLALGVVTACGENGFGIDETTDTVEDVAEDVQERANDALASLRTNIERVIDEARTGDNEAREQLLDRCRDALQNLREADDARADQLQGICDRIREADDEAVWDQLRSEIEEITERR